MPSMYEDYRLSYTCVKHGEVEIVLRFGGGDVDVFDDKIHVELVSPIKYVVNGEELPKGEGERRGLFFPLVDTPESYEKLKLAVLNCQVAGLIENCNALSAQIKEWHTYATGISI